LAAAKPHGTNRVNDVSCLQLESFGDAGCTRRTANARRDFWNSPTSRQQFWAGRAMHGAIYSAAAKHALVGSIYEDIDLHLGEVAMYDLDALHSHSLPALKT